MNDPQRQILVENIYGKDVPRGMLAGFKAVVALVTGTTGPLRGIVVQRRSCQY